MSEPKVIYEDKNFLAVNKPAGLLVHQTSIKYQVSSIRKREPTLVDWLVKNYPAIKTVGDEPSARPGIVHRLDKDTSGVLLIAKNQEYFEYLKSLFKKRTIKKIYLAWVLGSLKTKRGVVDAPIGIKSGTVKRSLHSDKMAKEAITEYKVLKEVKANDGKMYSLLEVYPKTGRTHQIRVHLASMGHPVVGDRLYGGKLVFRSWHLGVSKKKSELNTNYQILTTRLMLHALSLEFTKADESRMRIEAEPPAYFKKFETYPLL